jgi:hypothetical protein
METQDRTSSPELRDQEADEDWIDDGFYFPSSSAEAYFGVLGRRKIKKMQRL